MADFTLAEVQRIRATIAGGGRVEAIARAFSSRHTREEINEVWWATKRFEVDESALGHVNWVLYHQALGIQLISGERANVVAPFAFRRGYHPQF